MTLDSPSASARQRILFLIHDDYAAGGLQRSTMAAAECFVAAGHDVTVLCLQLTLGGFAERDPHVRGVTGHAAGEHPSAFALLRDLRRHILDRRPDLCIGMGQSPATMLRLVTFGLHWTRVYGSERVYPPMLQMSRKWRLLRALTLSRLDGLICQTHRTADYYVQELGIPAERLIVIPNVIAPPLASLPTPSTALARFAGHPIVACIGRHDWQKGFDMALPIFAAILRERPDTRLLIVGEGELEAQHRAQAHRLGLDDTVLFLPRFGHLAEIWSQVDVLLLTSRYEGIPNVLAEAMAYGIACVSFDCPTGPSELITDGVDGFLVPLGDCNAAATRCVTLLADRELRDRLGDAARRVAERFSQNRICDRWLKLAKPLQNGRLTAI